MSKRGLDGPADGEPAAKRADNHDANEAAAHGAAAASASAAAAAPKVPRIPQEPIDRSVPGPSLNCESFTYAAGGDVAAEKHFLCPISGQPLFDPVQCANGHYCCRSCLQMAARKCPLCRVSVAVPVDVGVGVKGVLAELTVECPDCGVEMRREQLQNHRNYVCQLPCVRACGTTVSRTGAAGHDSVCPLVPVKCDAAEFGCPWSAPRGQQAAHTLACGLRGVLPALRLVTQRVDAQMQQIQSLQQDNAAQAQRIDAQAREIQSLHRNDAAQTQRIDTQAQQTRLLLGADAAQTNRIRTLEAQMSERKEELAEQTRKRKALADRVEKLENKLAKHTGPLVWHTLGDEYCVDSSVTLGNGWRSDDTPCRFAKDKHGFVHLDGIIRGGKEDSDKVVLTLPLGFWPKRWQYLPADGGMDFGEVHIGPDGGVFVGVKSARRGWLSFAGITFSTE